MHSCVNCERAELRISIYENDIKRLEKLLQLYKASAQNFEVACGKLLNDLEAMRNRIEFLENHNRELSTVISLIQK